MKILVTIPIWDDAAKTIEASAPDAEFIYIREKKVAQEDVKDIDIILGNIPQGLLKYAEKLRFYQLYTAGSNKLIEEKCVPENVKLCCASGAYGVAIAEHMLASLFTLIKNLQVYEQNKKEHIWKSAGRVKGIAGSVTLVIGAGNIGSEFGRRMNALGSTVIGIRRHSSRPEEFMSECGTMEDIDKYLPLADYVSCTLPETPQTIGLFDRRKFELMKNDAVFINAGRGSVVSSILLAEILNEGVIGGACLDVTDTEPLPDDNPLWDAENLVLTPHISGWFHMRQTYDSVVDILSRNLKAFLTGGELISEVDRESGYRKFKAGISLNRT